ncbi:MAG TPA: fumarate reductase/succinate dehydrogenase flavoprotein subunit [Candidatus Krumholzibacteria bacterium]|nr:fumarate reductase/succinate dehydrogenase flavoprotein subunit [Candidatus Krumholzibacteria bacterium]
MSTRILDAKIPGGPLADKWDKHKIDNPLVAPGGNRRKLTIIVVGTGLAGGGAAATLGELGYNVLNFCIQDTPRRAHSVAAQGGINAAKNYQNDGDSTFRLFYDTIKGGDYRSREANVYRLAQLSAGIIDQSVAMGVPFAREYGGTLSNRSFGGVQVSRTFYARGQTGQQLLLGVYSALNRQVEAGTVRMFPRHEMLDLVIVEGRARGIIARDLVSGEVKRYAADAVVLATGGYSPVFYLSTNAVNSNATAIWRAHRRGALFSNPCYTQIHPTAVPHMGDYQSKLTLMSESLRNDGRVWVPKKPGDTRRPNEIPENERDYYLERRYPAFGNLVPRDIAARAAKVECDQDKHAYMSPYSVYLDFGDAIKRLGRDVVADRYGNLFAMYEEIIGDNPYEAPMMIYPAPHYTMGGLWVDYNLQSTIEGLFVAGEANFSDHGANRLGASALMQGLADGYFVVPRVVASYLAGAKLKPVSADHDAFKAVEDDVRRHTQRLLSIKGGRTVREIHWDLGRIMWDKVGMARNRAGLQEAITKIGQLRGQFWNDLALSGTDGDMNKQLEQANRLGDYLELGELMARDALMREESCGGHFRDEHQTEDGEARRDDANFCFVSAWEYTGENKEPVMHKEDLVFENVELKTRSYK